MTIQKYLEQRPLLFDGAMGTYLASRRPEFEREHCEFANLTQPELVQKIHEEYLRAGAVAIKTNTFAANCQILQRDIRTVGNLIRAGWEIANRALENFVGERFLFADIGPIPTEENVFDTYLEIVDIFLGCGAKYFLFETMENAEAFEQIAGYIKENTEDSFVMVSFAASPEGYTRGGFLVRKLYEGLQNCDSVDAVGFNCISGPKHLLEQVRGIPEGQRKKYLTVMPNAGYPTMIDNRIYYGAGKEYFGRTACELLEAGASIVGGCCGTTPQDIESAAERIEASLAELVQKREKRTGMISVDEKSAQHIEAEKIISAENPKNSFARKLAEGKKVIVVELDPPLEPDMDFFMEGAARYQRAGVDAIDIADCPIAKARIDSSILACKLTRELNLTAIPHMTCRDRNINATKALLLGLNVEGVNNVLTVTGDPVPATMREQVKTVFSYNSAVLARHIQSFNEEVFAANPFMVSGALNINAQNFDVQLHHAEKKMESGVSVLFTQPVLSERGFANLQRARKELPVKLLGGIMPVVSYRNAAFMSNEMAGIAIDEELIERYRDKDREESEALALEISAGFIDRIADFVDGYYVITPFKRVELILRIVEYIRGKGKR